MVVGVISSACNKFEFNIYETDRFEKYEEVTTSYNIGQLLNTSEKDTVHLAIFGDIQRFYDDLEDVVNAINGLPELDAVIITGDLIDFGVAWEFNQLNKLLIKLKVPFITVIGNHDLLGNGSELYEDIYGPLNYAFTWNRIRFIVHNTNSLEVNYDGSVPDLGWMRQQLTDTSAYNSCMFVSHMQPDNGEFDPSLATEYMDLLSTSKYTIMSAHGHDHSYHIYQYENDNTWYLQAGSPSNRMFSYVSVYPFANSEKLFDCTPVSF